MKKSIKRKKINRKIALIALDVIVMVGIFLLAEFTLNYIRPLNNLKHAIVAGIAYVGFLLIFRLSLSVYKNIWRYANCRAYLSMVLSDTLAGICSVIAIEVAGAYDSIVINACQTFIVFSMFEIIDLISRFVYQTYFGDINKQLVANSKVGVAICGAGKTGVLLAQELMSNSKSHYMPVCFIDVDDEKIGNRIFGLNIYNEENIAETLDNLPVQEIFIARVNITSDEVKRLSHMYSEMGYKVKIYDFPMNEVSDSGKTQKKAIREIDINDLLFRDSISVLDQETRNSYIGKTVMVTGCGSIGSELCRQIASCHPKKLVLVDIYENNVYDIQQELVRSYGKAFDIEVEIASVRDANRLDAVFATHRPEIVFHAAAHKHVPLMEHSCCEAVKNNVFGTYNVANLAEKYEVSKFIMVSTDKAVNPTNVMGATKRMCEMIVQCRYDSKTVFSAVRFGNVLGSNGSVIPLFKAQIANGGPVTITDKRIIRYFMTIPEASQLVMRTGAMAQRGDLFVLDMGNPVKIIDLAENLIRLSGYTPYEDIDIVEVGLRPGEKLYEELLIKNEKMTKTANDRIFIEQDKPFSRAEVDDKLKILSEALEKCEDGIHQEEIVKALKAVVPTFIDPETVNASKETEEHLSFSVSK